MNTSRYVSRLVQSKPVAPTRFFRVIAASWTLLAMVIVGNVDVAGTHLNTPFSAVAASV